MTRPVLTAILALAGATTLFARHSPILEPAEIVDTQQTIFASGGILELNNSHGKVDIVGWDQPQIEVTVRKSTHRKYAPDRIERALNQLDRIVVTTEPVADNHVVIRSEIPSWAKSAVTVSYLIKIPRRTKVVVRHDVGEVSVHDVTASIDVAARSGGVQLDLPATERFDIDAHTERGEVNSEWCAEDRRSPMPAFAVTIRLGNGEINIRRLRAGPHAAEPAFA